MRFTQSDKYEIILVEKSELSLTKTLAELGIHKSTFYNWYNGYLLDGYDGLADKPKNRKQYWNAIPEEEKQLIIETALEKLLSYLLIYINDLYLKVQFTEYLNNKD